MTWVSSIILRLFWWMLPRLLGKIVDGIGDALHLVELANALDSPEEKRKYTLQMLNVWGVDVPEWLSRGLVEFIVILNKLGVRAEHLERMQSLVSGQVLDSLLTDESARDAIITRFNQLFPDIPERAGRFLFELAVAKLQKIEG